MRADVLRIYKSVHTWTGIVSGMALFIAFYAGALTVFKEPLERWASPPAQQAALPLEQAQALIVRTLQAEPAAARDFTLHLHDAENVPGRLSWQVRDPEADDHDARHVRHFVATLDAEGRARAQPAAPTQLGDFIDVLHRVVGLPVDNDPNRWVMGVISALYALALVSGVIVLLPSLVKDFFALRVGPNLKRMWLDAHNVVGLVSLPFHVVMALTAVVFAFHDGIYGLQDRLLHEGRLASAFQRPAATAGAAPRDPAAMRPPAELLAAVRAIAPSFEPTAMQYVQATGPRAAVRVWGQDEHAVAPRARGGFVVVDPYSARVVNHDSLPGQQSTPNVVISSFFALHMASFAGDPVKWMYFVLGLAGAWLFYSGNLLWIESRRKRGAEPPRRTRWMAAGTIGVCLGSVCGISATVAAAKWLPALVDDVGAGHRWLYYAVFFAAIGWAFWRGSARASVQLLWAAAALTAAIPASSLLGVLAPDAGPWASASGAALAVDLTAAVAAALLAWMARATARRVRHGPSPSVWAAPRPETATGPVAAEGVAER
ncbi:PepSY-associated TM helix domain-containing protein [Rubrivivax gelatinosus]|uniref:Peptidase n=1 Tax=Rubrivivax gelatinosus TaxID=28068 RepID=A0ABS1DVL4_RUBGE|nr:PepSY-associated TM helix domain-containing protein [Rubrivivax gelatinosus]MBK1713773.1 peptidase [Rubrivivax gelatinosus]